MADVDDSIDFFRPFSSKDRGRVDGILLAESLEGSEAVIINGAGDGGYGLPFRQILHIPFSCRGQCLQLVRHAQGCADVSAEEFFDQSSNRAIKRVVVEECMGRRSG